MNGINETKKVIIVEDNREIREMYIIKLQNAGYEVSAALDGETGVELVIKEKPDLLLLDIMLPNMDGYEVLKKIKAENSKVKETPVIMLSNISSNEDLTKAKELGAADYFVKARSTPADVLKKVDDFFGK
jgi:DNA-binding response OmpR family regulator